MGFLLVVSFKFKLKFDGKQYVCLVFTDYFLSQFQYGFDCLVEVEFQTLNVLEDSFEDDLQCFQTSLDLAHTQLEFNVDLLQNL